MARKNLALHNTIDAKINGIISLAGNTLEICKVSEHTPQLYRYSRM